MLWKTFLNIGMTRSASTSCSQSSLTLKMACCQTSYSERIPSHFLSATVSGSTSTIVLVLRILNVAMNNAYERSFVRNPLMDHAGAMNHLGMTLQRTPRLPVDIDNLTTWITQEVNSTVDHNFCHLLVDLSLVSVKSSQLPVLIHLTSSTTFFSDLSCLM